MSPADPPAPADPPRGFGYKISWAAVRAPDAAAVAAAAGLRDARPSGWADGLDAAFGMRAFVTPPVGGVVAVVSEDERGPYRAAKALSTAFGEAWYFQSHRVSDLVEWSCFRDGAAVREFAQTGEQLVSDDGDPLPAEAEAWADARRELEADADAFDPDELDELEGDPARLMLDEESVLTVARAVGADFSDLDQRGLPPSAGLTGDWPADRA